MRFNKIPENPAFSNGGRLPSYIRLSDTRIGRLPVLKAVNFGNFYYSDIQNT